MKRIPLLVISGPTASGKTEAAIRVARAVGGEIISADSMQIYRGLDAGTAKPTPRERAQARFHLVDCVDPDRPYTVADYQRDATAAIAQSFGRGHLPILCGGTGLYIRAVTAHLSFPPTDPDRQDEIRRRLAHEAEAHGPEALHRRLLDLDPRAAAAIPAANLRRTIRALEVIELTGQPMSALQRVDADSGPKYNVCHFALSRPRDALYQQADRRVDHMLATGWESETRALLAQGLEPRCQALQAIGYRHLCNWLLADPLPGPLPAELVESIKRDTRRYAKRQLTWLRREPVDQWLEWSSEDDFGNAVRTICRAAVCVWGATRPTEVHRDVPREA